MLSSPWAETHGQEFADRLSFHNPGATLGIPVPALGQCVPIEEYIFFYLTGVIAVLLIYIWLDEFRLNADHVKDYINSRSGIFRRGATVYQLGRCQPYGFDYPVHQSFLGGDTRRSLRMVGLPAYPNDGLIHRGLVGTSH